MFMNRRLRGKSEIEFNVIEFRKRRRVGEKGRNLSSIHLLIVNWNCVGDPLMYGLFSLNELSECIDSTWHSFIWVELNVLFQFRSVPVSVSVSIPSPAASNHRPLLLAAGRWKWWKTTKLVIQLQFSIIRFHSWIIIIPSSQHGRSIEVIIQFQLPIFVTKTWKL